MPKIIKKKRLNTSPKNATDLRIKNLVGLLELLQPVPDEWLDISEDNKPIIEPVFCDTYQELKTAWEEAMQWTEGLDIAFSVMLASIASTQSLGDQLWVKIIGPASCGKSTLCEAVSVNRKFVLAKSTIRGFHSGFGDGKEDNSLISMVGGKTLVTKDGDTLLQSPNLNQILAEARDVYDTVSRTSYRNKASKNYEGIRMTWLLCGTSSLRNIDSSELGERFLDCVIMEGIDDELEDQILLRVAAKAEKSLNYQASSEPTSQQEPEMTRVMELTGGYINYLRDNSAALFSSVTMPKKAVRQCILFGKFVAYMRARPSTKQEEESEREFAARLVSQITRLAKCLAVTLNKTVVDSEVVAKTKKVALDTARGRTLEIVKHLHESENGLEVRILCIYTGETDTALRTLLRFLRKIKVVEVVPKLQNKKGKTKWRLSPTMTTLCEGMQLE